MMTSICIVSSNSFADQDYHSRNVFNRVTDWTATVGKNPEAKQEVINQRVEMRAQKREALVRQNMKNDQTNRHYAQRVNAVNVDHAKANIDNTRSEAMNDWQAKYNNERNDLNVQKQDLRRRMLSEKNDENTNYEKRKADLREQYKDDMTTLNQKLQEAENDHKMKINDLSNQWKVDQETLKSKERELIANMNKEKSDLNNNYDIQKVEVK